MNTEQIDIINKVKERGTCYPFSEDIKKYGNDKEFMLSLRNVSSPNDSLLYLASDSLKKDKEFVLAEVSIQGISLRDASPELQADRDIVLAAVKSGSHYSRASYNGYETTVLSMINPNFYGDEEIITEAIKNDGFILGEFSKIINEFDKDNAFSEKISNLDIGELNDDKFQKWCKLVQTNRELFGRLIKDKAIMLETVENYPPALEHLSAQLKDDEDVVLTAIQSSKKSGSFALDTVGNGVLLTYASPRLQNSEKFIMEAKNNSKDSARVEELWMRRLQSIERASSEISNGETKKQEIVSEIQNLNRQQEENRDQEDQSR